MIARTLAVFVAGKPAPQGSIRAIVHKHTGRAVAIKDNNQTQKTWRGDVRLALLDEHGQPIARVEGAVSVRLHFVMPRPKSAPKRSTPAATKNPDVDKLARSTLDALGSAGVWRDDAQVVELLATKRIAELTETPGCLIQVQPTLGPQLHAEDIDLRDIVLRLATASNPDFSRLSQREIDWIQAEVDHIREGQWGTTHERMMDAADRGTA